MASSIKVRVVSVCVCIWDFSKLDDLFFKESLLNLYYIILYCSQCVCVSNEFVLMCVCICVVDGDGGGGGVCKKRKKEFAIQKKTGE